VTRRAITFGFAMLTVAIAVAYLRDPPWLITQTTGLRGWEQQHDTPTPEMSFIFGLAVTLPMALSAVLLIMLNHHYE